MDNLPELLDSQKLGQVCRFFNLVRIPVNQQELLEMSELNGAKVNKFIERRSQEFIDEIKISQNRTLSLEYVLKSPRILLTQEFIKSEYEENSGMFYPTEVIQRTKRLMDIVKSEDLEHCLEVVLRVFEAELNSIPADPNEPAIAIFYGRTKPPQES